MTPPGKIIKYIYLVFGILVVISTFNFLKVFFLFACLFVFLLKLKTILAVLWGEVKERKFYTNMSLNDIHPAWGGI